MFSDEMAIGLDGAAQSMSSERVQFGGSLWCLDMKRYLGAEGECALGRLHPLWGMRILLYISTCRW